MISEVLVDILCVDIFIIGFTFELVVVRQIQIPRERRDNTSGDWIS